MHFLISQVESIIAGIATEENNFVTVPNPSGIGSKNYMKKQIYESPPHIVADNHFSGEHVSDHLGKKGFGYTCTQRRDRFPKELKKYCHHGKVVPGCKRSKAMRYDNPIVAVKQVPATALTKAYTKTLVYRMTSLTSLEKTRSAELDRVLKRIYAQRE